MAPDTSDTEERGGCEKTSITGTILCVLSCKTKSINNPPTPTYWCLLFQIGLGRISKSSIHYKELVSLTQIRLSKEKETSSSKCFSVNEVTLCDDIDDISVQYCNHMRCQHS